MKKESIQVGEMLMMQLLKVSFNNLKVSFKKPIWLRNRILLFKCLFMQISLTDQVSSAADFDRDVIEPEAKTDTSETAAAIGYGQMLPSSSIIFSVEVEKM